jgi:hypothetical protein
MNLSWRLPLFAFALSGLVSEAAAQDSPTLNLFGVPGIVDMPSGFVGKDGDFVAQLVNFGNVARTNFAFRSRPA